MMTPSLIQSHNKIDALLMQVEAEECRRSLKTFMLAVWPIIEPTPFVGGMPIDAMIEHLEAVTRGDIRKLVINIPPRHSKSSLLTIWRAWSWLQNPSERFLCASYSLDLSTRDNLRVRRIIEDPWFQQRFGRVFQLAGDQNVKRYFENTERGYQMALSVAGGTTGQGGSILVCLCYNVEVTTDHGSLCIGDIVEKQLPVRILAFDHESNKARWQHIEAYEANPGRPAVRVTFSDGRSIEATTDHPFYVIGKGYIPAEALCDGDEVVTDESDLRELREGIQPQTITDSEVQTELLQQRLSLCRAVKRETSALSRQNADLELSGLWQGICQVGGTRSAAQRQVLQSRMLRSWRAWRKQSRLYWWKSRIALRILRQNISQEAFSGKASTLLFSLMQRQSQPSPSATQFVRQLCLLRQGNKTQISQTRGEKKLLLSCLCQPRSQRVYQRGKQWQIYRWWWYRTLFMGVSQTLSRDTRARWSAVQALPYDERTEWQGTGCSSYRLRQRPQRTIQSCFPVPFLSREDARVGRTKTSVERVLVRCVEPIPLPEKVYNIRVAEDHNYFANGVLVHNCDDAHNADEAHSEKERQTAVIWFREVWTNRLNDQERDKMVTVGQRIHDDDVCGYILRERPDWVHLNLPAYYEPGRHCTTPIWSDPRKEENELLWPERFSKTTLEGLKRDLGSMGFAAQYQQRPVPAGGGQFKKQWFRYYTKEDTHYCLEQPEGKKRVLIEMCQKIITVDLAISQKQSADYTVIAVWAITPEKELLLLDRLREHLDNPEQQKQIQHFYQQHHPNYVLIESVAYQLAIVQQLRRAGIPVREYKPVKDKVSRASTASVFYEGERVFHPLQSTWLAEWEDELLMFPMGAHDDQVDNASMICDEIGMPKITPQSHLGLLQGMVQSQKAVKS